MKIHELKEVRVRDYLNHSYVLGPGGAVVQIRWNTGEEGVYSVRDVITREVNIYLNTNKKASEMFDISVPPSMYITILREDSNTPLTLRVARRLGSGWTRGFNFDSYTITAIFSNESYTPAREQIRDKIAQAILKPSYPKFEDAVNTLLSAEGSPPLCISITQNIVLLGKTGYPPYPNRIKIYYMGLFVANLGKDDKTVHMRKTCLDYTETLQREGLQISRGKKYV